MNLFSSAMRLFHSIIYLPFIHSFNKLSDNYESGTMDAVGSKTHMNLDFINLIL